MVSNVWSICSIVCVICAWCLHPVYGQLQTIYVKECKNISRNSIVTIPGDCIRSIRCKNGDQIIKSCPVKQCYNPQISYCDKESAQKSQLKLVCYYTNDAQYRNGCAHLIPENMNPHMCTHIHYAFAKLNNNSELAPSDRNDESTSGIIGMYDRVNSLKHKNPQLKVVLVLGSWRMASAPFTTLVATKERRNKYIQSAIGFLRKWRFDGLSIEWKYPGTRGSPPADKHRFTLLVKETMAAFQVEAIKTGKKRLLLAAAVSPNIKYIETGYEIPEIFRIFDYITLVSRDFYGAWNHETGHVSPLYPPANARGSDKFFNVEFAANYWVKQGCPKEKLVIGLATYGRSFTLVDPKNSGLKAPTRGPGKADRYTKLPGFLAYYEVKFIKDNGFAGAAVADLDLDYFNDVVCEQGEYPLLTTINNNLFN